ncbi:hypothetical protein FJW04_17775 [Mesorhizobium sp. B2-7-3]|nr:hypothetical protein FJW04_17775 [Mesorhizobium sp. B2-7-3]TPL76046.1 hypothetical protein FJ954_06420 [Mesorhizobium sp. B2-3-15]
MDDVPSYEVEEIFAGQVVVTHKVVAPTPFRAAKLATNREITLRASEVRWIRVFEQDGRRRAYEYTFSDRPQPTPTSNLDSPITRSR